MPSNYRSHLSHYPATLVFLFSLICIGLYPQVQAAPQVETSGFYLTTVGMTREDVLQNTYTPDGYFIGLQRAVAMAFARNTNVVFIVEKDGLVRVIVDGILQERPVIDMSDRVATWIDRGLGGIDVHPDFPQVMEIVLTYTHENGITPYEGTKYAKVARLSLREETDASGKIQYYGEAPTDEDVIVGRLSATADYPSCNDRPLGADCGAVDDGSHSFTFVRYGPDGKIYIGTGDGAGFYNADPRSFYAQLNEHLAGKILRVNPDGSGPEDNPFYTGNKWDNASKIFAKGLRNPKSGAFHPDTKKLCVGNLGWYINEGVYCLDAGDNVGWPCQENGDVYNGFQTLSLTRDGERLASCPLAVDSYAQADYRYSHQLREIGGESLPVGAIIGCVTANSSNYPTDFNGRCVYGDYVYDTIESVKLDKADGKNPSPSMLVSGAGQPVDIASDRNGNICYIAYVAGRVDGRIVSEIRCLNYDSQNSVQQYPVPSFTSTQDPASLFILNFDASASYHTSGLDLEYEWDFGDGNTDNAIKTQHIFDASGDYVVTLTVSTSGENISRTTYQSIRIENPDFVKPVLPSIESVGFRQQEHALSSEVVFDVRIRNDKGFDAMNVLSNIYDDAGQEVAHIVKPGVITIPPGETQTVTFTWDSASELGDHTIGIEFYADDWVTWTLKYPGVATFVVKSRSGNSGDAQVMFDDAVGPEEPTEIPADSTEASELPDRAIDANDASDANDSSDASDASDANDASDASDANDASDASDSGEPVESEEQLEAQSHDVTVDANVGQCVYVSHGNGHPRNGIWGRTKGTPHGCWLNGPDVSVCGEPDNNGNYWCPDGQHYAPTNVIVGTIKPDDDIEQASCIVVSHGSDHPRNGIWGRLKGTPHGCWLNGPDVSVCGNPDSRGNYWCPDGKHYSPDNQLIPYTPAVETFIPEGTCIFVSHGINHKRNGIWGRLKGTAHGCWLIEPDVAVCGSADNRGHFWCPDGKEYDASSQPVLASDTEEPAIRVRVKKNADDICVFVDHGTGHPRNGIWGWRKNTLNGCWITTPDVVACTSVDNNELFWCPDEKRYRPDSTLYQ